MRLYWEVARRGFRRHATYRGATFAGAFTNTVFGFLRAYVIVAVFMQRADVGGLDLADALTFVFVTQGMIAAIQVFFTSGSEITERIRSGDIVSDLYRPVDFQAYWLAQDLGRACFHGVFRGIPPVVVGALVFDLQVPGQPLIWLVFLVAVALANIVSFAIRFIIGLSAFWLLDDRGVQIVVMTAALFFSGFLLPLNFYPGWLQAVSRLLPFATMVQVPLEIFLGKHAGISLIGALGWQAAWALMLLGAGRALLRAAFRKVVIQGG